MALDRRHDLGPQRIGTELCCLTPLFSASMLNHLWTKTQGPPRAISYNQR